MYLFVSVFVKSMLLPICVVVLLLLSEICVNHKRSYLMMRTVVILTHRLSCDVF